MHLFWKLGMWSGLRRSQQAVFDANPFLDIIPKIPLLAIAPAVVRGRSAIHPGPCSPQVSLPTVAEACPGFFVPGL